MPGITFTVQLCYKPVSILHRVTKDQKVHIPENTIFPRALRNKTYEKKTKNERQSIYNYWKNFPIQTIKDINVHIYVSCMVVYLL